MAWIKAYTSISWIIPFYQSFSNWSPMVESTTCSFWETVEKSNNSSCHISKLY